MTGQVKKLTISISPEAFDDIMKTYRAIVLTKQFATLTELELIGRDVMKQLNPDTPSEGTTTN